MKRPNHAAINTQTGFLLRKVSNASFEAFSQTVGARGLHPMHFGLLAVIAAEEPISQQELSCRTGIDPSTMVARMDVLVERSLAERPRSTGDRRSYEIRLSAAGHALLTELEQEANEHGDHFFAALTQTERRQLHELLTKVAAGIDAGEPD